MVRKGRLADARVAVGDRIGSRGSVSQPTDQDPNRDPSRSPDSGVDVGESGRVGSPDDLIFVDALNPEGRNSVRIWTQSRTDGLNTPEIPLFKQLRDAVDKAYPQ